MFDNFSDFAKGQSAIEYLMTYGWMLLVVAVVGGAVFSVVGDQGIESVSGFNSNEIQVNEVGMTSNSLQMNIEAFGASSISLKEARIKDSDQQINISLDQDLSSGANSVINFPHVQRTDSVNDVEIELVYNSGELENLTTSGIITGQLNANTDLREVGKVDSFMGSSGEWKTVEFGRYYEEPVIVGVRNTQNGEDGIIIETKDISSTSADLRVCSIKYDAPGDGCREDENLEKVSYFVVDAQKTDTIDAIDAGQFTADQGIGEGGEESIDFNEAFDSNPYVFASVEVENGPNPVEGRIIDVSDSGFEGGICKMNNTDEDECSSTHPDETVSWIAIDTNEVNFNVNWEYGEVYTGSTSWEDVSFSDEFSNTPLILSEVQGYSGTQDVIVGEARNIDSSEAQVRFCEFDYDGECDSHNSNDVAWLAFEPGFQTVEIN